MQGNFHPLLKNQLEQLEIQAEREELQQLLETISGTYYQFESNERQLQQSLNIQKKQKKHADIKLDSITRKADNVVNHITEVIFETDLMGNWAYLNPAWEQLTGFKVIDCLGRPYYEFLKPLKEEDRLEVKKLLVNDFDAYCRVLEVQNSRGETQWLDINLKKLLSDDGKAIGYIGTIWDVSNQKKVELSLVKEKEKEALANKAKDEFLSTITHEIRTPLNAVIGTTHLLLLENPKPAQLENLNVLKHSSEHLLSLVNDILDFGKIESGKIELEKVVFNFDNRLDGLLATYGKIAEENKIGFSINRDAQIPKYLVGDATRLSQVLTNLVSNAIKFTKAGEVGLNVMVKKRLKDKVTLKFEVIDTGIGISKDKQVKIFDAFTQANSSTARKFGGTGLGLSICKKLVELMGSEISLHSEPGVGSIFGFEASFGIGDRPSQQEINEESMTLKRSLKGLSVLVAEDNKVNILMVKKFLEKWSIDYDIAENGAEAVKKYGKHNHDIILMDIMMPVMNGFEASKSIREFDTNVPIIALSASSSAHLKEEFEEAGMDGHIGKPFNPNTLFDLLKSLSYTGRENTTYDLGFRYL